ncbi:hypothetical protein M1K46_07940 [Fictibacillus sp. WQ 8-8]|uniref:hypothetical protein n=1 Tax=Fictibacillus sp. WQ 8-8 TaxID=2938788 RepID=UPI00210C6A05|nr:hypothetical protein [Fictibacillus sp. WQ 8-8]MCQ6265593.1 hypothetical protein [Fictibacillus sp. WQ 8-8]
MKNINHLFNDLEEYRTPLEMKRYFEEKKQNINKNNEYVKLARLKKGLIKEFLEEFYPLYLFSQSKYCDVNSKCKIILGNQGYDGSIIHQDGTEKMIEITSYMDGKWEFEDAKRLNLRGYGDIRFNDNNSLDDRTPVYFSKIVENIKKKSQKNYSGVCILFVVNTFDYFEIYDNSSQEFVNKLIKEIAKIEFIADEIYLLVLNEQGVSQIDENLYLIK